MWSGTTEANEVTKFMFFDRFEGDFFGGERVYEIRTLVGLAGTGEFIVGRSVTAARVRGKLH